MIIKYNTRRLRKQCEICGVSVARLKGKQTLKMSTSVLVNPAEVRLLGRWPCGASSASSRRPCRSIHQVQNDATCTQCNLSSSSSLCRFFYLLRDKSSIVSVRPTICIFSIIWSKSDFSDTFFRKKKNDEFIVDRLFKTWKVWKFVSPFWQVETDLYKLTVKYLKGGKKYNQTRP